MCFCCRCLGCSIRAANEGRIEFCNDKFPNPLYVDSVHFAGVGGRPDTIVSERCGIGPGGRRGIFGGRGVPRIAPQAMSFVPKRRGKFLRNLCAEGRARGGSGGRPSNKMEPGTAAQARIWRSHPGPRIYMSDHEYESTKNRAAYAELSINRYIRRASLTCDIGADLVHGLAQRVDRVGHKLNEIMHFINRGGEVRPERLRWILSELERTLDSIPQTEWIRLYQTQKGPGSRRHRGWVRGSTEDLARIKERAELVGLPQSTFVRAAALQGPLGRKAWNGVMHGLQKWLSNLNQMGECRFATVEIVGKTMRIGRRVIQLNHEFSSGRKYTKT